MEQKRKRLSILSIIIIIITYIILYFLRKSYKYKCLFLCYIYLIKKKENLLFTYLQLYYIQYNT